MSEKMTKREMFTQVHAVLSAIDGAEVLADGIAHEIALLDRKRASKSPDAKKMAEQMVIKQGIVSALADADAPMKATDIAKTLDRVTVQRVTALITQMVKDGSVIRSTEKKDVFFSLA
jgi:hypothetical protein